MFNSEFRKKTGSIASLGLANASKEGGSHRLYEV